MLMLLPLLMGVRESAPVPEFDDFERPHYKNYSIFDTPEEIAQNTNEEVEHNDEEVAVADDKLCPIPQLRSRLHRGSLENASGLEGGCSRDIAGRKCVTFS